MKDAKGHGSNPRGSHAAGIDNVGREPLTTLYHGSGTEFSEFQLGHGGTEGSKNGVWLARDPQRATEYAHLNARHGGAPVLYHATLGSGVKLASQKQWEDMERSWPGTNYTFARDRQMIATLQKAGYHGVDFGRTVFVFDPTHISIVKKEKLK